MTPKKSKFFTAIQLLFLLLLAVSILSAPAKACSYAALALQLWFEKMIPSLFPFMILSGLIVRLDFGKLISAPVYPLLGRLYNINKTMCTTLLCGFLFGFPLGAKTVAEGYSLGQLSKPQAQYLLSFCNNIGPVYLFSFALPLLGLSDNGVDDALKLAVITVFFGIPLLYGLVLRHTVYRRQALHAVTFPSQNTPSRKPGQKNHLRAASRKVPGGAAAPRLLYITAHNATINTPPPFITAQNAAVGTDRPSFISALDASVTSACAAITRLGGYMIFFIVCNLLLEQASAFLKTPAAKIFAVKLAAALAPVLEITSGLALSKDILHPAILMTMLTFGGLSCFAQTYTCVRDTDLSFGNYCLHKILQSVIAFFLYTLLFSVYSARGL